MDENDFLKAFAKSLGADGEVALKKIEDKKIKEQKFLEDLAIALGPEAKKKLEEIENQKANELRLAEELKAAEAALLKEKKEKEQKLLEQLNASLSVIMGVEHAPETVELIEKELNEVVPFIDHPDEKVTEDMVVKVIGDGETPKQVKFEDLQPVPELPLNDIVTQTVKNISKTSPQNIQQAVDELPPGIKREIDILKKSILDLQRFATNHSQLGGGGEVNLRYLDDIDRTTILDGLFLKYDAASKKFVFATPPGSATTLVGLTDVIIDTQDGGEVLQYNVGDDKYHVQQLSIATASVDAGDF